MVEEKLVCSICGEEIIDERKWHGGEIRSDGYGEVEQFLSGRRYCGNGCRNSRFLSLKKYQEEKEREKTLPYVWKRKMKECSRRYDRDHKMGKKIDGIEENVFPVEKCKSTHQECCPALCPEISENLKSGVEKGLTYFKW